MRSYRRSKVLDPQNPLQMAKCHLAKGTYKILERKSKELCLPISRLIYIAVDNELEKPKPFTLLTSPSLLPETESSFEAEAMGIANYMLNFPQGLGREMLMLCRRDAGISEREKYLFGYRELLRLGRIREGKPPSKTGFPYPPTHTWVRLAGIDRESLLERRRKIFEKLQMLTSDPTALHLLLEE